MYTMNGGVPVCRGLHKYDEIHVGPKLLKIFFFEEKKLRIVVIEEKLGNFIYSLDWISIIVI